MHTNPEVILKQAVESITEHICDGLDPQSATIKVAKELSLNTHLIKRASEAINVALTHNHFKKHPDAKASDFPIVDAQKVAQVVYTEKEPTITQKVASVLSGAIATEVPNYTKLFNREDIKVEYQKIAADLNEQPRMMSVPSVFFKSAAIKRDVEQSLDNARTDVAGLHNDINLQFADVAEYWKKAEEGRTSFKEFETQAYTMCGANAEPYLDLLYKAAELKEDRGEHKEVTGITPAFITVKFASLMDSVKSYSDSLTKLASATSNYVAMDSQLKTAYHSLGCTKLADAEELVESLDADKPTPHEQAETPAEEKEEHEEALEETDPVKLEMKKKQVELKAAEDEMVNPEDAAKYLTPRQQQYLPAKIKQQVINSKKKLAEDNTKEAGMDMGLTDMLSDAYHNEAKPSVKHVSSSPMDNLDRKLLLQDLISTDPILKSHDPKQVATAYQQILRLAPELSLEPEVVRSQLRTMMATQAMSPFDAGSLVDTNTKLLKQKLMQQGALKPDSK